MSNNLQETMKTHHTCIHSDKYNFACGECIEKSLKDSLERQHQADMEEIIKIVERIDDSGGGSGRRLKIQLINTLKDKV